MLMKILRIAAVAGIIVLLHNVYTDIRDYGNEPREPRSTTAVPHENPTGGSLTWSADGRLLVWQGDTGGKFVNAPLPASLNAPKSRLCRMERATTPNYATPGPSDVLETYDYRVASASKQCDTGRSLIWAQHDHPSGLTVWFDSRTNLLLRYADTGTTEGQTFCAGVESTADTWLTVDVYNGGGPFFDNLGCVRAANHTLGIGAPQSVDKAAPAIKQVTSELLPLLAIAPCQDQFLTGCPIN